MANCGEQIQNVLSEEYCDCLVCVLHVRQQCLLLHPDCRKQANVSDDTSVAILERNGRTAKLHFHEKVTAPNGVDRGINPARAINSHQFSLATLVDKSLASLPVLRSTDIPHSALHSSGSDAVIRMKPNFVSVTRGPGISVALSIGLEYAKGLATAWQVPLIGVNHMHAHTLAPRLAYALAQSDAWPQPAFPFLTLLVSGGHTMLHLSKSIYRHQRLAGTKDVAVGNALDQIARSILPPEVLDREIMYGRLLEEFAQCPPYTAPVNRGDLVQPYHSKSGWTLSMPLAETREMAFSYSGLESSVRRITKADLTVDERRELARQSLRIAFEHLADRVLLGLGNLGTEVRRLNALVVSGGVASNQYLRQMWVLLVCVHPC